MRPELEKKVESVIRLIKMTVGEGQVEVSFSGGKDSEVILELAKMAGVDYRAIYKNTTIDPPHTIAHCKSKGVEIMKPTITFFDKKKKKGFPTRRARFCCEKLKECLFRIYDLCAHFPCVGNSLRRVNSGCFVYCPIRYSCHLCKFKDNIRIFSTAV